MERQEVIETHQQIGSLWYYLYTTGANIYMVKSARFLLLYPNPHGACLHIVRLSRDSPQYWYTDKDSRLLFSYIIYTNSYGGQPQNRTGITGLQSQGFTVKLADHITWAEIEIYLRYNLNPAHGEE